MTKKILSIIPARGGSKGIPRKNIVDLAGKPLIFWTIEASLNARCISKTVVSSDDDEILALSRQHGAEVLKRPKTLALDNSPSELVVKHVLETLLSDGEMFDYVVLLQPTSPLRNYALIEQACEQLFASDADALISVVIPQHSPLKSFMLNGNGYLRGAVNNSYPFMPRQELPPAYMANGAIYIISVEAFMKTQKLFTDRTLPFVMDEISSADIDSQEDLSRIKEILEDQV